MSRSGVKLRPPLLLPLDSEREKNATEIGFDLRGFALQGGVAGDAALPAGCFRRLNRVVRNSDN